MLLSTWLRRLTESYVSTLRTQDTGKSRPSPRRRLSVGLENLEGRLVFSVVVVNSLADGPLASLRGNGKLELREVIQLATHPNTTIDGYSTTSLTNTIQFDPSLGGQTITLSNVGNGTAGPSAFGVNGGAQLTIDGKTGLTSGVTIERGSTAGLFRLFYVDSTSSLSLNDVTLRGGNARGSNGGGGDNGPGGGGAGLGGAIFNQGTLKLLDVTLTGNTAQGGNGGAYGVFGPGGGGGGMGSAGGNGSGFAGPGAGGGGPNGGSASSFTSTGGGQGGFGGGGGGGYAAAIPYGAGSYPVVGRGGDGGFGGGGGAGGSTSSIGSEISSIDGNDGGNGGFGGGGGAPGYDDVGRDPSHGGFGGGWGHSDDDHPGDAGGGGGMGGAIFNEAGTVSITNSTLTGNTAKGGSGTDGDALAAGSGMGGGIFNHNGTLNVTSSTLSNNTADQGGRGIYQFGDGAPSPTVLKNNIIGQSDTNVSDFAINYRNGGTTWIAGSEGNLIRTTSVLGFNYNILNSLTADPSLGALANNGGLTPTMKPQAGSAVIDAGSNSAVPDGLSTDQRGVARVRHGSVDIGAVETGLTQSISFSSINDRTYGDADFRLSASATSNLPVSFTGGGSVSVYQESGVWYAHITGAGSGVITATQDGGLDYDAASSVTQYFQIGKAASQTTTVGVGPFTYNGTAQLGGSGTVTGFGGLKTNATSLVYTANADGSGPPDLINAGTYYVTAFYAGDANHLPSHGAAVAITINKAAATLNVTGYTGTYDGAAHGATGTAIGVNGTSVGTLNLGATFTNVPGGTAHWTFDGGQNYLSQQGDVAINILAKHITGAFTAADKIYDGKTTATVTSRSLVGVVGTDAVSLIGGTATFASKNVGTAIKVTLSGSTLTGAAAGNYVLDSVATATATISPRPLTGSAATQDAVNIAKNGELTFKLTPTKGEIIDGQTAAQLFTGTTFNLATGGRVYSVAAKATVAGGVVSVSFKMTSELKEILAATTKATSASKAPLVSIYLWASSKDYNYAFNVTARTKLFNTAK